MLNDALPLVLWLIALGALVMIADRILGNIKGTIRQMT